MHIKLQEYLGCSEGQFAIWTGIAAMPILLAASLAIDFGTAEKSASGVKQALDASVIAAVSNNGVGENGKKKIAKEVFAAHYHGDAKLTLNIKVSDGRVEMSAKGRSPVNVAKSVGMKGLPIDVTSAAEMNRKNTICVLALAESGEGKLRFLDETKFNSPTCSVQSNSKDAAGVISETKHDPKAKSFCSVGGGKGDFYPAMRGQCRKIDDPYEDKVSTGADACMPLSIFGLKVDKKGNIYPINPEPIDFENGHEGIDILGLITLGGGSKKHSHQHCHFPKTDGSQHCHYGTHDTDTIHGPSPENRVENIGISEAEVNRLIADYGVASLGVAESVNYTQAGGVYQPGTYCGGLTVDGENVTFLPGKYVIKDGPLTFKNKATASADDVSFVLSGENSVLTVESGSYVNVKAPKSGATAGLAFAQAKTIGEGLKLDLDAPTAVNLISSGGELNVTGTMYFPTQALEVLGDSVLGAKAPATSFIARQVTFAGSTQAEVKVDHVKGGIPPMLPRSDDGARLVE